MSPIRHGTPWDVLRSWPDHEPVACWLDLGPDAPRPGMVIGRPHRSDTLGHDPLGDLRASEALAQGSDRLIWLGYEAGGLLEPCARATHGHGGWATGGVIALDNPLLIPAPPALCESSMETNFLLEPIDLEAGRAAYISGVHRVLEYIRAGDVYQVNLTHRLTTRLHGSPRGLAAALFASARPWHGAYFETTDRDGARRAVISASPELFLEYDAASGSVKTRPMKGTRPRGGEPSELREAEKDRAELNMIVDLMRNDLGRVCALGSVRVDEPRAIEDHGSVLQATATVSGRVRPGLGPADVLGASFPPGSVTGTPKIRAMQIIGELEPGPRGPYCGCIGLMDRSGRTRLNVAIRTALLTERDSGVWDVAFPVGAGIVADSDPEAEWRETVDKAQVLMDLIGMSAGRTR